MKNKIVWIIVICITILYMVGVNYFVDWALNANEEYESTLTEKTTAVCESYREKKRYSGVDNASVDIFYDTKLVYTIDDKEYWSNQELKDEPEIGQEFIVKYNPNQPYSAQVYREGARESSPLELKVILSVIPGAFFLLFSKAMIQKRG